MLIFNFQIPPHFIITSNQTDGVENHILQTLSSKLNFTAHLIDCHMNFMGKNGVMNLIKRNVRSSMIIIVIIIFWIKVSQFGISNVYMREKKLNGVTFTQPYIIDDVTFTSPLAHFKSNSLSFFEPFDKHIWIFISIISIITLVIDSQLKRIKWNLLWKLTSILLKQACKIDNEIRRLILFCWMTCAILLSSSFCGCIYSQMTRNTQVGRINTLVKLSDSITLGDIILICNEKEPYYKLIKVRKLCKINYIPNG